MLLDLLTPPLIKITDGRSISEIQWTNSFTHNTQFFTQHTHSWTSDQRENDLLCWQFHQWTQVCSCDGPFAVAYSFSLTYKHNLYPLSSQRCVNSPQSSPPLLIRHGTTVMPFSFCVTEIISSTAAVAFCSNQQPLLHSPRWEDGRDTHNALQPLLLEPISRVKAGRFNVIRWGSKLKFS